MKPQAAGITSDGNVLCRDTKRKQIGVEAFVAATENRAIFTATRQTASGLVTELYEVNFLNPTGTRLALTGGLAAGEAVRSFLISADGRFVVYRADQAINERVELYVTFEQETGARLWRGYE